MPARSWIRPAFYALLVTATASTSGWGQPRNQAPQSLSGPPPLNAKVGETLMGPRSQRIVISEDGDHLAIVTPKGSREVVLIDGVEGPVFDEIPLNFAWSSYRESGGPMVFSPTGGHSAYVARRAGDFMAVVDGKEAVTLQTPATLQGMSYSNPAGWKFWFSQDGSHLAYGALGGSASWVMVFDGVKSPGYRALDFRQTALKGKRLVYVAQTADQQWHAVVDGKPGPGYAMISLLNLTPDGAHYAYLAQPVGGSKTVAVVDGVESGQTYQGVGQLEQAPDGRVAYMAATKTAPSAAHGGGAAMLVVGGMELPGSCGMGSSPMCLTFNYPLPGGYAAGGYRGAHVAWRPDGKRFAYIQPNAPNPGVTVMVNGKPMGQTYQTANDLSWSPDGNHLVYVGVSPTGTFPVMDGQELSGYNWIKEFQWSPDGKRYAFYGANSTGIWMVVDGKVQPKAFGFTADALRFSPDSKHVAYGAQATVATYQPVVDGVAKPYNLQNFFTRNNPPLSFPVFSYSPDGNHLAYMGFTLDQIPKGGVIVDGTVYSGPTASFTSPSWSPDSKHFAAVITTGKGWVVMIDGKLSPLYEDVLSPSLNAFRFVDGHTYRFYAVKAGEIYRVTLDLGA